MSIQERAILMKKPQYKALGEARQKAIAQVKNWFVEQTGVQPYQGSVLAEEIVDRIIKSKKEAIHSSAPDVFLNPKDVLSSIVSSCQKMALALDEKGELFKILDAHETKEENEKHSL